MSCLRTGARRGRSPPAPPLDLLVIFEEYINEEYYRTMETTKKAEVPKPDKEERAVYNNLETEIWDQTSKALKGNRHMEAYILAWSGIEQFMLPNLMRFIEKELNIKLPKLDDIQASNLTRLYFFLSHDVELYNSLEKARKTRNKLVHSVSKHNSWSDVKKGFKKGLKEDVSPIMNLFQDRFKGKTPIPVLTLYTKGWNDALSSEQDMLKKLISELE